MSAVPCVIDLVDEALNSCGEMEIVTVTASAGAVSLIPVQGHPTRLKFVAPEGFNGKVVIKYVGTKAGNYLAGDIEVDVGNVGPGDYTLDKMDTGSLNTGILEGSKSSEPDNDDQATISLWRISV